MTLFNTLYGLPALVILVYRAPDGSLHVKVYIVWEGVLQGCAAGSFGYCLAHHHHIIKPLAEKYKSVVIRIATNDTIPAFPPPQDPSNSDSWEELYNTVLFLD